MDEDAVLMAIGGLTEAVKNQGREIGEMKQVLQNEARSCRKCKDEIDGRLNDIDKRHEGEKAVSSFMDTSLGRISVCIGILTGSVALIVAIIVPAVVKVMS